MDSDENYFDELKDDFLRTAAKADIADFMIHEKGCSPREILTDLFGVNMGKTRKGGPVPSPEEKKKEYVIGWNNIKGTKDRFGKKITKEDYCIEKGISPGSLDNYLREFGYK